ncbi:MAG: hypothetical protein LBM93_10045 [Oscillospiraceae bacterium]|nr:hypothetical protein [Oscillospiraceae bacterium]
MLIGNNYSIYNQETLKSNKENLDANLFNILEKCLNELPENRYQNFDDLLKDINTEI